MNNLNVLKKNTKLQNVYTLKCNIKAYLKNKTYKYFFHCRNIKCEYHDPV